MTVKLTGEDFVVRGFLGRGAFGKVFLVEKKEGTDACTLYALKTVKKSNTPHTTNQSLTERQILARLSFPFIVKLFYAFQTETTLNFVLEYAKGGELFSLLRKENILIESEAAFYLAQLCLALKYLHDAGIIYRDLKPENILLDSEGYIKITDFGLCKIVGLEDKSSTFCGTIEYMAPEVLSGKAYSQEVDWWSLGAVGYDMLVGKSPFYSSNRKSTIEKILKSKLEYPKHISPYSRDILAKLLKKNPNQRIKEEAIFKHKMFRNIDWLKLRNREICPPYFPNILEPDYQTSTELNEIESYKIFPGFSFDHRNGLE